MAIAVAGRKSILSELGSRIETDYSDFDLNNPSSYELKDPALQSAWVNICVYLRARNVQRPTFKIFRNGKEQASGPIIQLFQSPNPDMSASSLWFWSQMWWDLEGEFFWWWGPDYHAGIPNQIFVINPRRMYFEKFTKTWIYTNDEGTQIPLRPEEFLHVFEPNPWNPSRGIAPMAALAIQLEQSIAIDKEHLMVVRNSAIPDGVLKTDVKLTPEQAEELKERWSRQHSRSKRNQKISVLGSGAEFQPLNADLIKYLQLVDVTKNLIITKYGIPDKVVNAANQRSALSGKDSDEQYKAFWSQTLIPHLRYLENELYTKFFFRYGQKNLRGSFDLTDIPELQEDEADLHGRLREDIKVNLITINEAREVLHRDPVDWGDQPFASMGGQQKEDPKEEPKEDPKEDPAEEPEEEPADGDKAVSAFFPFTRRRA